MDRADPSTPAAAPCAHVGGRRPRSAGSAFPARIYSETVLAPAFTDAKRALLEPLLAIESAHLLMLARQAILPVPTARVCLRALDALDLAELRTRSFDGSFEDLFFLVEGALAELCGPEDAGRIHTARSRNDIDMTMYRMVLRERILTTLEVSCDLRATLVGLAGEHRASLLPAITHGQPAQPTTLGHYLMAAVADAERSCERLRAAYARVDRSPLGACAITTTGFPIDRRLTADLLGFDGVEVNSYGAIASVDYVAESCSVLAVAMLGIGRLVHDLVFWSTAEVGYLRLSDGYVQASSIMPQKRNPVSLEHVRILASRGLTEAQAVLGSLHNTPFADMNDAEDSLQPLVALAFADAERSLRLLTGVLSEASFDTERMRLAAGRRFLTVTELADTLVRTTEMSFAEAPRLVSAAVREATDDDPDALAAAVGLLLEREGRLPVDSPALRRALDPTHFVESRAVEGGPAPRALDPEIERAGERLIGDRDWLRTRREAIAAATARRRIEADRILAAAD